MSDPTRPDAPMTEPMSAGAPPACFGLQLNWMMEDCVFDPDEALKCYDCPAFDRCHRLSLIRSLQQMKYEVRKSAREIGRASWRERV